LQLLPSLSCSFLRPGARFTGKQTSDKQEYEVNVEFKHVDMSESFLCGYLRIQGLTEYHPTLTTYFEGEMIGPKYSFMTRHSEWGATEETDLQHWAIFPPYKQIAKKAGKPDYTHKNFAEREYIFMRWKEYFLVPDHNVRSILGASFEGFYYVCFHQLTGSVSGIYFHTRSEKFQKLKLSHVNDRYFGSFEFR
ncbi:vacuolar import and degradation protein, partial [Peziza echinospora]